MDLYVFTIPKQSKEKLSICLRNMRGRIWLSLFLALLLVCLFVLISHSRAFIQLFFEHSGIAITQNEIANAHNKKTPDLRPQLIPKIIHQVFHEWGNKSMPADWEELRQTCINTNCDWEYMVCGKSCAILST